MTAHIWKFFDPYDPDTRQCTGCRATAEIDHEPTDPCPSPAANEVKEAAALQSWLVANARQHRPMTSTGLMGWALSALQALSLNEVGK